MRLIRSGRWLAPLFTALTLGVAPVAFAQTSPPPGTSPAPSPATSPATTANMQGPVVNVNITDIGFTPASISVAVGGTVTWTNQGNAVHTATASGNDPVPFDTGGLGGGQNKSVNFTTPGIYTYNSAPDCLNGNTSGMFNCGVVYSVTVGSGQAVTSSGSPAPAPGPVVQQNATIALTDTGFQPANLALALNGTVTFSNQGTLTHTATSGSAAAFFDTGGLAPGQAASVNFTVAGTYQFTSTIDCSTANGNTINPNFNCAGGTITVTQSPVGATNVTTPGIGTLFVYINDASGYQPPVQNVKAGTTVTWLNLGSVAHSVDSDAGSPLVFNSGGLSTGDTFSVTFTQPGTYTYHSNADPLSVQNNQPVGSKFSGKIVVQ
ncbi:MAG: hypothetical protein JOZ39_07500 [Chloroflexi bacterium]|nr:hypothetical protein [Chloroflexota bacterium]